MAHGRPRQFEEEQKEMRDGLKAEEQEDGANPVPPTTRDVVMTGDNEGDAVMAAAEHDQRTEQDRTRTTLGLRLIGVSTEQGRCPCSILFQRLMAASSTPARVP